jgi:hypothetical protein
MYETCTPLLHPILSTTTLSSLRDGMFAMGTEDLFVKTYRLHFLADFWPYASFVPVTQYLTGLNAERVISCTGALTFNDGDVASAAVEKYKAQPEDITPESTAPEDITPESTAPEDITPESTAPEDVMSEEDTQHVTVQAVTQVLEQPSEQNPAIQQESQPRTGSLSNLHLERRSRLLRTRDGTCTTLITDNGPLRITLHNGKFGKRRKV